MAPSAIALSAVAALFLVGCGSSGPQPTPRGEVRVRERGDVNRHEPQIYPTSFHQLRPTPYLAGHLAQISTHPVLVDLRSKLERLKAEEGYEAAVVLASASIRGTPDRGDNVGGAREGPLDILGVHAVAIVRTSDGVIAFHNLESVTLEPEVGVFDLGVPLPAVDRFRLIPRGTEEEQKRWAAQVDQIVRPTAASGTIPAADSWDGYPVGFIHRSDNTREETRAGINCFNRGDGDEAVQAFNRLAEDIFDFVGAE